MTLVDDLYRTVVLDHGKRPRRRGAVAGATHAAEDDNPLCGDALRVEVVMEGDHLRAVGFTGESCAIATASASLMSERVAGGTLADAGRIVAAMESLCTAGPPGDTAVAHELGDLMAFAGVHRHPVRIACALLAWRILRRLLSMAPNGHEQIAVPGLKAPQRLG